MTKLARAAALPNQRPAAMNGLLDLSRHLPGGVQAEPGRDLDRRSRTVPCWRMRPLSMTTKRSAARTRVPILICAERFCGKKRCGAVGGMAAQRQSQIMPGNTHASAIG